MIWKSIVKITSYTHIALYCLTASAGLIASFNSRGCNLPVQAQKSMARNSCLPRTPSSLKNFHREHTTEKPDTLLPEYSLWLWTIALAAEECASSFLVSLWAVVWWVIGYTLLAETEKYFVSFHSVSDQYQSLELQPTFNLHSIYTFQIIISTSARLPSRCDRMSSLYSSPLSPVPYENTRILEIYWNLLVTVKDA